MSSLADDNVSLAHLSSVIEMDTVLSGNVLRLVNSVLYGRRGTVSSVRHALGIIGLTKLRNYVLGLSVSQLWKKVHTAENWSIGRFNQHSMATAVMGDLIVQRLPVDNSEAAFAAGLLHDIGRFMIAVALPDECERILQLYVSSHDPLEVCEQEIIDVSHAELGAAALARWNLPVSIQRAIAAHHQGPMSPLPQDPLDLARVVLVANELADHFGYSVVAVESERARDNRVLFEEVGLSREADRINIEFEGEIAALLATI